MIKTGFETRVKIHQIVENQLPEFILSESPKTSEFLKHYYLSQEAPGGSIDIVDNLDQYLKLDNLSPEVLVGETKLISNISDTIDVIFVENTKGFPQNWGLIKIDDEIITYTGITTNSFIGCVRGFSGITTYHSNLNDNELVFSTSKSSSHSSQSTVVNLSSLFLKEFYKKIKYSILPGLEEYDLDPNLNVSNFLKESRSLYLTKGTKESFRILFNILYGVTPKVVDLEQYLVKPSAAEFIRREVIVVEKISGDPLKLVGQTIRKSTDPDTKASVSEVEILTQSGLTYYKLSLFVGFSENALIEGTFNVPGKTKVIGDVSIGSSVITVDSTVEFPDSGTIFSDGNAISYTDRTINQFLGCSNVTETIQSTSDIRSDEVMIGYEDGDLDKKVELRITGVLSEFVATSDITLTEENETIYVKNFGEIIKNPDNNPTRKETFANSWIYNTSVRYQVKSISGSTFLLYSDIDKSSLKVGDKIEILRRGTKIVEHPEAIVTNINKVTKEVLLNNLSGFTYDSAKEYDIRRLLNKAISSGTSIEYGNNKITSDVQNVYNENDEYMYVASNSLPSYTITSSISQASLGEANGTRIQEYNPATLKYSVLSFGSDVPFITGDEVYYRPEIQNIPGLTEGLYYVKVLEQKNKIKLYTSRSFILTDDYIEFDDLPVGTGTHIFTLSTQNDLQIGPQKSLKKFTLNPDIKQSNLTETEDNTIGLLINGVELSSYKTNDRIYYGPLEDIKVLNIGQNYDVIRPPYIEVSSPGIGTTALVQAVITGSIKQVFVDGQDFDIDSAISATITGGNGTGGILKPITSRRYRELEFNALPSTQGGGLDLINDDLSFIKDHNILTGQALVYDKDGNDPISIGPFQGSNLSSGEYLENGSVYYAQVTGPKTIKLYRTKDNLISGINTVGFTTVSASGIQKFRLLEITNTISRIDVLDSGSGYCNRKLIVKPSGISTSNSTITFKNHGFEDGEKIVYSTQVGVGTSVPAIISGLTTSKQYQVIKLDDNTFRLADAGIGGTITDNYTRKLYTKLNSTGRGYQVFQYPPISVDVSVKFRNGISGIITATPVIRGTITDIYLYEAGTNYGSNILNLHKKPLITIKTGKEAVLKPYIKNGKIDSVQVLATGKEYYSTPDLTVVGEGVGAILRPIIVNNSISEVKIISGGIGYSEDTTTINVTSAGSEVVLDATVRSLRLNRYSRFGQEVLKKSLTNLKYSVVGYPADIATQYFSDTGLDHSPIIGWSLDGNPIYGPYGYSDPEDTDSAINIVQSGYALNTSNIINRPPGFDNGFFIEDYVFNDSGDLDQCNGRFCKTPDFPNGTYAYFATVETSAQINQLIPKFPYFIGDKFRSNLLDETYIIDQYYKFKGTNIIRNTLPYNTSDLYSGSDFLIESNELINQRSLVESVLRGSIDSLNILEKGVDYKVGDSAIFDNTNTEGSGASAQVSLITGKTIENIDTTVLKYDDALLIWKNENEVQAYISTTHAFQSGDNVYLNGISTSTSLQNFLNKNYRIGITTSQTFLYKDIAPSVVSGSVTDLYVAQIPDGVSVGSSLRIKSSEIVSVLNVFPTRKILRVKRSSPGAAYTASSQVELLPSYFSLPIKSSKFDSRLNDIVYFNAAESIGVGTTPGFNTTLVSTIGIGETTELVSVPTQSIRIPNHPFKTNQKVLIKKPPGTASISISTTPGGSINSILASSSVEETFYVIKKSNDLIGIVTNIGLTTTTDGLFFRSNGSNDFEYQIRSDFNKITSDVNRITTLVSLTTSHGLQNGDSINLLLTSNQSLGIGTTTSVKVKYDPQVSRLLINPIGFTSSSISIASNSITINNHNFATGDKIYYQASQPASGLSTGHYFVYVLDQNSFSLTETLYDLEKYPLKTVSISSRGGVNHQISLINPELRIVKNNNIVFDLSDSSLFGYKLKFFYDKELKNEFVSVGTTDGFLTSGIGTIGLNSNASITVNYGEGLPSFFYYGLEKSGFISTSDPDVKNASKISYIDSVYTSKYSIFDITPNTFKISLSKYPEKLNYDQSLCSELSYTTNSTNTSGGIAKLSLTSSGSGYKKLPVITGFRSTNGSGSRITPKSNNVGKLDSVRIIDSGFEYPSDVTLKPQALIPSTLSIINNAYITEINVLDGGKNYQSAPDIVVTNANGEKVTNGSLSADLAGSSILKINILDAPNGLDASVPKVFAINNSNGYSITNVVYNKTAGIVTCKIRTPIVGFSTNILNVGDKIFVEGLEKYGASGNGFNSPDNNFNFFSVVDYRNTNPAEVDFDILPYTTNAGVAVTSPNFGSLVRYIDYPQFSVITQISKFSLGEKLYVYTESGSFTETDLVVTEDRTNFIKAVGRYELFVDDLIFGAYSGTRAKVNEIVNNKGRFEINYSIRQDIGWIDNIGKLNEDYQVLPDNDYYQALSYTIKSPIEFEELITPVNSLLHTTGLKNFADTEVKESAVVSFGSTLVNSLTTFDFINENRVDTIYNFDLAVDTDILEAKSKSISLKNKKLTGYIACKTNNVLKIDDISSQFSNTRASLLPYVETATFDDTFARYLVQVIDPASLDVQASEVIIATTSDDVITFEKESISSDETNASTQLVDIIGYKNEFGDNTLRFYPVNYEEKDYDIKVLKTSFNSDSVGVGTINVGFINLSGSVGYTTIGVTTQVAAGSTNSLKALYVTSEIYDTSSNSIRNVVDLFVTHDGIDTYQSEYYFDTLSKDGNSYNFIGTFTASLTSGILRLNYQNTGYNGNLLIRSKIVGFGTTATGIGTYRSIVSGQPEGTERSFKYQSNYTRTSIASTSVVSFTTSEISVLKSLVRVSYGNTSALHQVLVANSNNHSVLTLYPFVAIGTTSGIGTFGLSASATTTDLRFYKDSSITANLEITAFSEFIYTESDFDNDYPIIEYGKIRESLDLISYNAIFGSRSNRKSFNLLNNTIPIFTKKFNPSDTTQLVPSTGLFKITNHFFNTGEKLKYTPKSSFIGINSISVGIGSTLNSAGIVTNILPSEVYAIRINSDQFKLATRKDYALAGIYVTFTNSGSGNAHELEMDKKLEKTLITIDGVTQYPIAYSLVKTGLTTAIDKTQTLITVNSFKDILLEDILKIDDELLKVTNVGLGTTLGASITGVGTFNQLEVTRAYLGSTANSHSIGTSVYVNSGNYNIVGSTIHFTDAPIGKATNVKNSSNVFPDRSSFSGRVYLRQDYTNNRIFDDFSSTLTGLGRTYTTTILENPVSGIETGNTFVFLNGIFQAPTTFNNPNNVYDFDQFDAPVINQELNVPAFNPIVADYTHYSVGYALTSNYTTYNTGISSIVFSGITSANGQIITYPSDINANQLPRGGVIVSLGATQGLGFAPLYAAQIGIITSASGGIGTIVATAQYQFPRKSPLGITSFKYDNISGVSTFTVSANHNLKVGDPLTLYGLKFACNSWTGITTFNINSLVYNKDVGIATLTVSGNHGLKNGKYVKLANIILSCSSSVGYSTTKFPHPAGISTFGNAYKQSSPYTLQGTWDVYRVSAGTAGTTIVLNVGISTLDHTYVSGGTATIGITTDLFPYPGAGPEGGIFKALAGTSGTTIVVNAGVSTIAHTYVSGGICTTGLVWKDWNYGSGYSNINPVSIAITSPTGNNAQIIASVGIGGTLVFTINNSGSGYASSTTRIDISEPSYENLPVVGVSRVGVGSTTETGSQALITLKVGANDNIAYDGRFYDAANLLDGNIQLIAEVAVGRMLAFYPGFSVPNGNTECIDDIKSVLSGISYNLRFGGNDKVYDAANLYRTNPILLAGEESQAVYAFTQAKLMAMQAVNNQPITIGGYSNETQFFDYTVIGDTSGVVGIYTSTDCANVLSAIDTFVGIITATINTGSIPTTKNVAPGSLFQVTDFKLSRPGYGFRVGDVFKPVGLVTDGRLTSPISEFELTVLSTFTDRVASWEVGEFDYIDSVKDLQNGVRTRFPLRYAGNLLSFEKDTSGGESSQIDLANLLLIYCNSVLQVPGESYTFEGGTTFNFAIPPSPNDEIAIFFYNGTRGVDSFSVTVNETLKVGDTLRLNRKSGILESKDETDRTIYVVSSSDSVETNLYSGQGIDPNNYRQLDWTKQKIDKIINGETIYKSRDSIESLVYPTAKIIKNFSTSDTEIFVDDAQFFNYEENESTLVISSVGALIIDDNTRVGKVTGNVGAGGTIQSITINDQGLGYTGSSVSVVFEKPSPTGTAITATALISVVGGKLSAPITITNPGSGYTASPKALLTPPTPKKENIKSISTIEGFSGIITGITTTTGTGGHSLALSFSVKNPGSNFDSLQVGYPIYVFDTVVGKGVTSVDTNNSSRVGVGTTFLDNIYYVHSITKSTENAVIVTNINTQTNIVGIGTTGSRIVGRFSWGKMSGFSRGESPVSFTLDGNTISGLSTYPSIQRRDYGLRSNGSLRKEI